MVTVLRGKGGKFAGSIGDGKARVPAPAPTLPSPKPAADSAPAAGVDSVYERFERGPWRPTKGEWFDPAQVTDKDPNYWACVGTNTERVSRLVDDATDQMTAMLRTEQVSSVLNGDGQRVDTYVLPAANGNPNPPLADPDHRRIAIRHTYDERKIVQTYQVGMLSQDGTFEIPRRGDWSISNHLAEGSDLADLTGGTWDEVSYSVAHAQGGGAPVGLEVKATSTTYEARYDD